MMIRKCLYLLSILAVVSLSSCRTSCGCPMAEVEVSADPLLMQADA